MLITKKNRLAILSYLFKGVHSPAWSPGLLRCRYHCRGPALLQRRSCAPPLRVRHSWQLSPHVLPPVAHRLPLTLAGPRSQRA